MMGENSSVNAMAAEVLETSVSAFAAATTAMMQQRNAIADAQRSRSWRQHLTQRILELAAAVRVGEPSLFARRVEWLRRAYQARGFDEAELATGLESLAATLAAELPESMRDAAKAPIELALDTLRRPPAQEEQTIDPDAPTGALALRYLQCCLEGKSDAAVDLILDSIDDDMTPQRVYLEVLVPAQQETGQLWHAGDISVAEERLVSETTRRLITLIGYEHRPAIHSGRTVLAASVAGNAHDMGLRVLAELFRLAGWQVQFLGADVPPAEISRAARLFEVDLVLLNATLELQLKELGTTIAEIRSEAPQARILVGGHVFKDAPELWRSLEADGFAPDAAAAIEAADRLVESR